MKNIKYTEVSLAQVGVNEDAGVLQKWLVDEGQFISVGNVICEFETTKTIIEIEAECEGYIIPVINESSKVKVGDTIAIMVKNKKNIKSVKSHYLISRDDFKNKGNEKYNITKKAKELINKHNINVNVFSNKKGIIRTKDVLTIIDELEQSTVDYELSYKSISNPLIIYGAGKGAVTLFEAVEIGSSYNAICFVDDDRLHDKSLLKMPVFHSSELKNLIKKGIKFIACEIMNGRTRLKIKGKVEKLGYELVNIVHPKAVISKSVQMGKGNYIKSAAIIETNTLIGNCCIIDNGAVIAHDNNIGNGCHIAPGVSLGSNISIGDHSVIGIGASISTNVKIGKNCIISVGSSITKNVPNNSIVEGVPGKVIGNVKI